jgi:protease-4
MKRLILLLAMTAAAATLTGCLMIGPGAFRNRGRLHLETLEPADSWWTSDEVLLIPLSGLVAEGDAGDVWGEPGMLVALKDRLLAAEKNDHIKAVILRIDSPGGTVTAADLIYHEIVRFKEEQQIPVVALMGDVAASGGFYIAMAADEVYALPTTITGSIGVIVMLPGLTELSKKIGLEMRVIKSGENKDAGSLWSELSEEQRLIFQQLVYDHYDRFLDRILEGRAGEGLERDDLAILADGRIFNAEVALDAGLIDGIVYPEDVKERAKELAGLDDATLVSYEYPGSYRGHFYARTDDGGDDVKGPALLNVDLKTLARELTSPRLLYLWSP